MNNKSFGFIMIRLFSLYFFLQAIRNLNHTLVYGISYLNDMESIQFVYPLVGMIVSILFLVSIGILLYKFTDRILNIILPNYSIDVTESEKKDMDKLSIVLFSAVGLYIIAVSLPELCKAITRIILLPTEALTNVQIKSQIISDTVGSTMKLVLGVYLTIGSKGIYKIINKVCKIATYEK